MAPPDTSFIPRIAIATAVVALVGLLIAAAVLAAKLLLLGFAAILIAVFLRGLSDWLTRSTSLPPRLSLPVVVLALMAIATVGGWLLAPSVADQFEQFVHRLPELQERLSTYLSETDRGRRVLLFARDTGEDFGSLASALGGVLTISVQGLLYMLVVVVTGLYLSVNPSMYVDGLVRLFPKPRRERMAQIFAAVGQTLRWYLLGRVISMIAVGLLTGIGLAILGIPMAALLGVIAGVLTFVPYAGPIAAGVPIAIIALVEGPGSFIAAIVYYTLVQGIEGFVITPLVQERVVKLAPALVLVAEMLLGILFGPLGVVLSVPLAAVVLTLVRLAYVHDALGDDEA